MFPNYWQITIGMLCLVMSACQSPFLNGISSTLSSSHSKTATDVISTDTNYRKGQETAKVPAKFTISTRGIGDAQIGLTYGQLKAKLGQAAQFQVKAPFIVDFDAIAVYQSGQVQYYIL